MRKYTQKELRQLVRLGVAEDYTNKPSDYIYTLNRLDKVGNKRGETMYLILAIIFLPILVLIECVKLNK